MDNDIIRGTFEVDLNTGITKYNLTSTHTIKQERIKSLEDFLENTVAEVNVDKRLTTEQRKKIWCILDDFAYCNGGDKEQWREQLQTEFCRQRDYEYFSISELKRDGASKDVAREFIQWLCELAVTESIGFREETGNPALWVPDIGRYVIACLRARRCAVCGKVHDFDNGDIVDLDHWSTISSSAGTYENDDGLQNPFVSLCRLHHSEKHNIGVKSFEEKYHIGGIWLNEQLVYELLDVYPNHFRLFRKRLKEGYYDNVITRKGKNE
ncbi:putative HNHc nuclease [Pseudoleptotrichia goodfellowii]|uniref:Uncharacterized protein n=1 Tax=Pseudoleptotrichia goodfellowii TaxID=157692 RepID=A0A510J8N8_9FUSO|nr:putative HNHc nuclease [Pseudoleptotrichia goodfellowii]BBM35436.1 hypothetical protein JCM16774_0349 [Pseudoleptotrichia goodfellowii]